MFGENAAFIKSVEIDDSIFQCDPQCAKKYLLQLEWSRDNEAWQWRVLKSEDVLTSNDASDHSAIESLQETIAAQQILIGQLTERIAALEG